MFFQIFFRASNTLSNKKKKQQLKQQQQLCRAPYRTSSKSELPPAQQIIFFGTLLE